MLDGLTHEGMGAQPEQSVLSNLGFLQELWLDPVVKSWW